MARLVFFLTWLFATAALAAPSSEAVLRDALADLPKTEALTPEAERKIQTEMDLYLRAALEQLGPMKSLYGMGSFEADPPLIYDGKKQKLQQFQATYEHGWIQWRVFVRPDGRIGALVPFSINAPGAD